MKRLSAMVVFFFISMVAVSTASAGDFDWLNNLNVKAEADSSGFRVQLATRFRIGDADVKAVIGNVDKKSDAYMVLRLGELSHRPVNEVLSVYEKHRNKGWGVIAKNLGIKPGSREFHALKRGHDDLGEGRSHGKQHMAGKGNGKGKGNGMGKGR